MMLLLFAEASLMLYGLRLSKWVSQQGDDERSFDSFYEGEWI